MKFKVSEDFKIEKENVKDGKLNDYDGRTGNDMWKFEDDGGDAKVQNCMWLEDMTVYNKNVTHMSPAITWAKTLKTSDGDNDIELKYTDNLTGAWKLKWGDAEMMGSFEGFYIDDPMNPVITGATNIVLGSLSAIALIAATLA
jgi:hypothetical protein